MIGPYSVRGASEVERQLGQCVCSADCEREVRRVLTGPKKDGTVGTLAYCEFHYQTLLQVVADKEALEALGWGLT